MALIFCDGFDAYATSAEVADKWTTVSSAITLTLTGGRFGGGAVDNGALQNPAMSKNVPTVGANGVTIGGGCWFKSSSWGTSISISQIGSAGFQPTGISTSRIVFPNGSATAAFATAIYDNAWHWIEWSVLMSTTVGTYSASVDGIVVASGSGVNTGVTPATSVASSLGSTTASATFIDDMVFWDSTGTSFNTFPLGAARISTLIPSGAGASTQYTPSTGTNWSCVAGAYSGTAKVTSTVTGQVDLYTYPNLPIVPSSIYAVVGNYYGQNSGVGSAQNIPKMRTGSTTVSGTASVLPTGTNASSQFAWYADAGGSAWTDTSVNAVQLGMGD